MSAGTREWWLETLEDWAEEPEPEYEATAESLSGWPEGEAVPYFRKREVDKHALGEVLTANAFEGLARYEVHLDRKLERTPRVVGRPRTQPATPRSTANVERRALTLVAMQ